MSWWRPWLGGFVWLLIFFVLIPSPARAETATPTPTDTTTSASATTTEPAPTTTAAPTITPAPTTTTAAVGTAADPLVVTLPSEWLAVFLLIGALVVFLDAAMLVSTWGH